MDCKGTLHATVKPNSNNCFYYNIWRFQFQYPYPGSCTLTSTWLSLGICYIMFGYIGAYFKAWHSCQPHHLRNWRPLWSRGPCHLQWRGSLRHSKVFQPQPAQRYPQVSQRPNVTTIRMKSSFPTKRQWFPTSMHLRGWLLHNSPGPNRAPLQHHRWPGSLCCQRVKERQLWLSQTGCQTQIPQMLAQEPFPIPMGPFKVIRGPMWRQNPLRLIGMRFQISVMHWPHGSKHMNTIWHRKPSGVVPREFSPNGLMVARRWAMRSGMIGNQKATREGFWKTSSNAVGMTRKHGS